MKSSSRHPKTDRIVVAQREKREKLGRHGAAHVVELFTYERSQKIVPD